MFQNNLLNRIMELTKMDLIKWKQKPTIVKNTKRYIGLSTNHKFVLRVFPNKYDKDYIKYIAKQVTEIENTWEDIRAEEKEIIFFIDELLILINNKKKLGLI